METPERLIKIVRFLFEVNKFKLIDRKSYVTNETRRETDAEHVWHTLMFAMCLHREIDVETDLLKVLEIVAVHDLVEIYAGDTFAYDLKNIETKKDREAVAAEKLFDILPPDIKEYFFSLWTEYEEGVTNNSRFAHALDKLQGFTQQIIAEGRTWQEEGIFRELTYKRTKVPHSFDTQLATIVDYLYEMGEQRSLWPKKQ